MLSVAKHLGTPHIGLSQVDKMGPSNRHKSKHQFRIP